MGKGFGKASSRARHLHPPPWGEGTRRWPWDWGQHQSTASSGDSPALPTAPAPVLAPSGLSGEEATGTADLGLFPPLWTSPAGFGACWPAWPGGDSSQLEPSPHGGASPEEGPAADPAPRPSPMAQELLTSAGAATQPLGIPRAQKITPKWPRLPGLEAARDPSASLPPACSEAGWVLWPQPRGKQPCSPSHAAFQEKAAPECTKCGSPETPARSSCTSQVPRTSS